MTIKVRILVAVIAVLMLLPPSVTVLSQERNKKIQKMEEDKAFYLSVAKEYEKFQQEYSQLVEKTKQENVLNMQKAETEYKDLLAQQDVLVAQHTRKILADSGSLAGGGSSGQSNSGTSSTTKSTTQKSTKVMVKPSSSTKTRSS